MTLDGDSEHDWLTMMTKRGEGAPRDAQTMGEVLDVGRLCQGAERNEAPSCSRT